jgi:general secretion pathway protein J
MTGHTRSREAGFTLLELLVAATLLALLMAILFGGLRTGTRVWEAGEQRGADIARLQAAHGFLRRQISELYPLQRTARAGDAATVAFDGDEKSVTFTGLLPAHFDIGGFQSIRVGALEDDDGLHLGVEWVPFDPEGGPPADIPDEQRARLLENIDSLSISYFGAEDPDDAPAWVDAWTEQASAPLLVRLEVSFEDRDRRYWPELIVRVPTTSPVFDRDFDVEDADDEENEEDEPEEE